MHNYSCVYCPHHQQLPSMAVDIEFLDFGTLCFLVGQGFNQEVLTRLHKEGYPDMRVSFGYVVQHLLEGEKSVTQLASCMGITQQAVSKRVREMLEAGVLEVIPGKDRRESRVALSHRGRKMVARTRAIREALANELLSGASTEKRKATRQLMLSAMKRLGIERAVEGRRIQEQN